MPGNITVSPDGTVYVRAASLTVQYGIGVYGFTADDSGNWSQIENIDLSTESSDWVEISVDASGKYLLRYPVIPCTFMKSKLTAV